MTPADDLTGTPPPAIVRNVLWIDCSGGIVVGVLMLVLGGWLRELFRFPALLYDVMASGNLGYGLFSLVLASLGKRPVVLVSALAIANAAWGCACLVTAIALLGQASILGMAHLLAESGVVFWLARIEWRHRALIAGA